MSMNNSLNWEAFLKVKRSLSRYNPSMPNIGSIYMGNDETDKVEITWKKNRNKLRDYDYDSDDEKISFVRASIIQNAMDQLGHAKTPGCLNYSIHLAKYEGDNKYVVNFMDDSILVNGKPLDRFTIQDLKEIAVPSSFGDLKTTTTKIDHSIRNSFEISSKQAKITFKHPWFQHDINDICKLMQSKLYAGNEIKIYFNKIVIYEKGGFFKLHQDTPNPGVVGSFVIVLPTRCQGGDFILYDEGKEVCRLEGTDFQKDTESSSRYLFSHSNTTKWVAFYPEMLHQVTEITSGYRISVTFEVKMSNSSLKVGQDTQNLVKSATESNFLSIINKAIQTDENHCLGFILAGGYSTSDYELNNFVKSEIDVALMRLLSVNYNLKVVPVVINERRYDDRERNKSESMEVYLHTDLFKYWDQNVCNLRDIRFFGVGRKYNQFSDQKSEFSGTLSIREVEYAEYTGNSARAAESDNFYYTFALIAIEKTRLWSKRPNFMLDVEFHHE